VKGGRGRSDLHGVGGSAIFLSTAGVRKAGGLGALGFQAFGLDAFGFLAGGLASFLRGEGGDPLAKLLGSKGVGFRHRSWH
jgi:hypothetical protein